MIDVFNVTLNPGDMGPSNTLSNGNLTVVSTAGNTSVRATHGRSSKKWYFETKIDSGSNSIGIGISNKNMPVNSNILSNMNQRLYYCANGNKYPDAVLYSEASAIGDVVGVLIDLDNGTLEFRRNNKSLGISNTDIKTLGEIYPFALSGIATSKSVTFNFGASPFKYPLPIGYNSYDGKQINSSKFLISSEDKYFTVAQYSESDDIIPALTGNVTALGNVIRSDENASYPAWQAFDKKAITSDHQFAWISATMMSGWIGFDFSIPIIIDRYSITGRADSVYTMSPKDWTFEGSNDGTNWTVLDTRRNVVDWNTTQTRTFIIGNKAKYKTYRINAVSNNSSNGVLIKEIKMGCSNQGTYLKNVKLNNAETAYLSHGMSKSESIGLDISFSTRIFVNPTSTTLGAGKVFKQRIDTTKIPIKKASIT